jgi:hypothetical protein
VLADARVLRPVLVPKLRPGLGERSFEWQPIWARWQSGTGCWTCAGKGCFLCADILEAREDAFLEESLEAATMHEPLPYPAESLEWPDQLSGAETDQ